ncbi:hypothetical protein SSX86_010254 [Deinandra increscens subsp. villosa]|uniref:Uncharacterized protein n=1 Tax=Deinandra increscens subsp. villosa TaxID=3103831 RepID=A0AAP0DBF9_9ASTR
MVIKQWRSTSTDSRKEIANLISEISDLDRGLSGSGSLNGLGPERVELVKRLHDLEQAANLDLAQKAKVSWAGEGDENSKLYHSIINKKRRQSAIRGIKVDGIWVDEPNKIKDAFVDYFSNKFRRGKEATLTHRSSKFRMLGDSPLKLQFNRLFRLAENKLSKVSDILLDGEVQWAWRRPIRDGAEAAQLADLDHLLAEVELSDGQDTWVWQLNGSNDFSVKDIRKHIDHHNLPLASHPTRWISMVPKKIQKTGKFSYVETWAKNHSRKGVFVNKHAAETYEKIDQARTDLQCERGTEEVDELEILGRGLGERSGYILGVGRKLKHASPILATSSYMPEPQTSKKKYEELEERSRRQEEEMERMRQEMAEMRALFLRGHSGGESSTPNGSNTNPSSQNDDHEDEDE